MADSVDQRPRVSIVIPAHNAEKTLGACLSACLSQTHPNTEVIVVDDGSTDATPRIAEAFPVHYIRQENRGPAAARNRGAAEATGSFVAFTDADCVPEPDWIAQLLAVFAEGVVAVGGTYGIANPESILARMIHEEIALRHAHYGDDVDFLGSFNVMYDREAFQTAGGFDEAFSRASAEDNDLSYRLLDAGGKLRFVPHAIVKHFHPTRLGPYLRTQARHGFWRMRLYAKHPNRAYKGDRYAGLAELAAPALALLAGLALCHAVLILIGAVHSPIGVVLDVVLFLAYVLFRYSLLLRLALNRGDARMLLFLPVLILRDIARGIGMLAGVVRFMVFARGMR